MMLKLKWIFVEFVKEFSDIKKFENVKSLRKGDQMYLLEHLSNNEDFTTDKVQEDIINRFNIQMSVDDNHLSLNEVSNILEDIIEKYCEDIAQKSYEQRNEQGLLDEDFDRDIENKEYQMVFLAVYEAIFKNCRYVRKNVFKDLDVVLIA